MNPNQNDPNNPPQAGGTVQPDLGQVLGGTTDTPPPPSTEPPVPEGELPSMEPTPAPPAQEPVSPITTLDNPMQAPVQPPPIDSGFSWSQSQTPTVTPADLYDPSITPPGPPAEAAPTDLSHLVANSNAEQPVYTPPITQPETLVTTPQNGGDEIPNIPTENQNGGVPKWLVGLGVGILLAVVGTSVYFILGVGKGGEQTPTSLPATTKRQTLTPPPTTTPTQTPATGSGTFGELGGSQAPATSAADLLKQRQSR